MGPRRRASFGVKRKAARLETTLTATGILAVIWGALAFGAVYPWAYAPLAVTCALTGCAALLATRRGRPPIPELSIGLAAIGLAIAVQLAPLPRPLLDLVSPNADTFLGQSELTAAVNAAGAAGDADLPHAASLVPRKTALGLALFASFAVFLLGMTRLASAVGASAIARSVVVFGIVLALVGIAQYVFLGGLIEPIKIYGFWGPIAGAASFGPFINRNHFAGWMLMALPLALGGARGAWHAGQSLASGALSDRISWLSSPSAAGAQVMSFGAAVMGLSLLMSQSRSGMVGFAAGALMFASAIIRRQATVRSRIAAAVVTGLILTMVAAWAGLDPIARRVLTVRDDAATAGGRRQAWSDTLRIVRDFPIAGTGLDTFGTAMLLYQTNRDQHFQEAHNDYLQLAAEGGLLIGVPVLFTLGIFVRDVRRRFKEAPKEGTTYWLRVGAVIGLVSIALQSSIEFSLQMPGNAAFFAVVAAIALHRSPNLRPAGPSGDSH
jgi:O-antigen ligase